MANGGVSASQTAAERDKAHLDEATKKTINDAASKYNFPPALLAGIASRESRMGTALDANGWGDHGNAYGIMQVDKNANAVVEGQTAINSAEHIDQAARNLQNKLDAVEKHHPDWPDARKLQRAVALYNGDSSGKSHTLDNVDEGTTGGDYSNDVWARSQIFAQDW